MPGLDGVAGLGGMRLLAAGFPVCSSRGSDEQGVSQFLRAGAEKWG